jgi:hypothetical protein
MTYGTYMTHRTYVDRGTYPDSPAENKNGQTQAFGRSERLSSIQTSMSSRMNFSTLHFASSYP